MRKLNLSLTLLIVLNLISLQVNAEQLRIAVAANFYSTLSLIQQQFEKEHDDKLVIIKGSTGKLYAQIKHGAPYDIFMAADARRPQLLEQERLTVKNSRYTYANGLLALWSKKNQVQVLSLLKKGHFKKLAVANPKTAPYGFAAAEVLTALKLNDVVKNKLVYGENIAQVFQFVQSGSATLGFVALSYVKRVSSQYWQVPQKLYSPLKQQMVILKRSKKQKLASKFADFLKSEKIKHIIKQQGYVI